MNKGRGEGGNRERNREWNKGNKLHKRLRGGKLA